MERSERSQRLLTELLIIVTGVLMALGAQGAVQEWSNRQHEHAFLVDLLAEFRLNETQLHKDIGLTDRAVAAADRWRQAGTHSVNLEDDSVAALYAASLNPARFDPLSGSLRSLIDGGDLGLIRNRQLRAALAGWNDRTQEQVTTSFSVDMMRSMLTRFLVPEGRAAPLPALRLDRLLLQVVDDEQNALLEPLREIIAMLEQEVGT
jgi:hypothetical protein